jgi:hypothetical protein
MCASACTLAATHIADPLCLPGAAQDASWPCTDQPRFTEHDLAIIALWMTAAVIVGAFAAALAAFEGGQLRDGAWHGATVPLVWAPRIAV